MPAGMHRPVADHHSLDGARGASTLHLLKFVSADAGQHLARLLTSGDQHSFQDSFEWKMSQLPAPQSSAPPEDCESDRLAVLHQRLAAMRNHERQRAA